MKASRQTKLALWIIGILLLVLFYGFRKNGNLISPLVIPNLQSAVENSFDQTKGRYGIFIKNLKTSEEYKLNDTEKFDPGSLYKLKLLVLVFEQIKDGKISEDESISANVRELNRIFNIASDEAELTEGTIEFSVKSALEQMITISHNYAAMALTLKTKAANLAEPTSAKEIGEFFEKIYTGQMIGEQYSKKMLELLKRQDIGDRIPRLLPEGVEVAHKTGDIGFFEHDGGIVFAPKGDYIIVVLTETDSPENAADNIAKISKAVYDYFSRKKN